MDTMTLPEYAKGLEKDSIERPLVETFAASSDIFSALRFEGVGGSGVYEGYREEELPVLGFRAINEAGTSGEGTISPFQESSFILDHDLDVDRAIVDRHGQSRRAKQERLAMASAGKLWTDTFLAGDNTTNVKEFNGLKQRATGERLLHNSTASGGAALSLYNLDNAIKNTYQPSHIIASRDMQPRFIQAARDTTLSGFVIQTWDQVGGVKMSYAGLPILWGYPRDKHGVILPYNEVGQGGGAAVTASIFIVSFGDDGVFAIQIRAMDFDDKGLLENGITYRTHFAWDVGLVDEHPFCMTRLTSITDAAFVK